MPTNIKKSTTKHRPSITSSVQQEYLIHAYHSTRVSQKLTHQDALSRPDFWTDIRNQMLVRGCLKHAPTWRYNWQQMHSKLLVRIERARRLKQTTTSWLGMLSTKLLAVMLDCLDETQLAYVEQCLAEDVQDEDDRLALCAKVYRDVACNRFVIRCHHCRQTFDDADELLAHIRRHYDEVVPGKESSALSDDDDLVVVAPKPQSVFHYTVSSDDEGVTNNVSRNQEVSSSETLASTTDPPAAQQMDYETECAKSSVAAPGDDVAIDPTHFGFVTDEEDSNDYFDDQISEMKTDECSDNNQIIEPNNRLYRRRRKVPYTGKIHTTFPIKCTFDGCPATFFYNYELNDHTLAVHNRRPYKCPQCPRSLESESMLRTHQIGHERRFECDICKRKFPDHLAIFTHMKMHDKTAVYKCSDCNLWYNRSGQRRKHWLEVHGGDNDRIKKIVCEHCGMSFHFMNDLKRHLFIRHSQERPYKCDLCGETFRQKQYVALHIQRIHTEDRPFQCREDGCMEQYRNVETRLRHERKVHGRSCAPMKKVSVGVIKDDIL